MEIIEKDDILFFAGDTNNIMDLINASKGLILPDKASDYHKDKTEVIEAVIAEFSSIIGKTVKEADFRNRYDAAIIAVHRNGEKISGKIGDIEIKPSDVLLLYSGNDFANRVDSYRDLYVINKVREIADPGRKKYYALGIMFIGATVLFITKGLSLFPSLLIIVTIMAVFGLITVQDIRRELDFNLIGILVFFIAMGVFLGRIECIPLLLHRNWFLFASMIFWHLLPTVRNGLAVFTKPAVFTLIVLLIWK